MHLFSHHNWFQASQQLPGHQVKVEPLLYSLLIQLTPSADIINSKCSFEIQRQLILMIQSKIVGFPHTFLILGGAYHQPRLLSQPYPSNPASPNLSMTSIKLKEILIENKALRSLQKKAQKEVQSDAMYFCTWNLQ